MPEHRPANRSSFLTGIVAGAALAGAFFAGTAWGAAGPFGSAALYASTGPQGRQPPRVVDSPDTNPTAGRTSGQPPLVYETSGGGAMAANGMIAVTGSYGVGTSVLYVIDSERRQLSVYEARGGASATRRLTLVGARRIDLDLQLEGYNDESEFSYQRLQELFERRRGGASAGPGAAGGDGQGTGGGDGGR